MSLKKIAEGLEKLALVSQTYMNYRKEHPKTKKRPSDFAKPLSRSNSGKPIFKHYNHPKHRSFGVKDHKDAWEVHTLEKNKAEHKLRGLNNLHPQAQKLHKKVQFHENQALGHMGEIDKIRSQRKI